MLHTTPISQRQSFAHLIHSFQVCSSKNIICLVFQLHKLSIIKYWRFCLIWHLIKLIFLLNWNIKWAYRLLCSELIMSFSCSLNVNFNLYFMAHLPSRTEKGLNPNIIFIGMNMKKTLSSSSSSSSCEEMKLWKPWWLLPSHHDNHEEHVVNVFCVDQNHHHSWTEAPIEVLKIVNVTLFLS